MNTMDAILILQFMLNVSFALQLYRQAKSTNERFAVYDEKKMPDVKRLNDILVCEAFVNALAEVGCMVTRIDRTQR